MKEAMAQDAPWRRNRRTATEWGEEIARWKRSGLTARDYAAKHGLSKTTLFGWSRKLRVATEAPVSPTHATRMPFLPLRVDRAGTAAESASFEIEVTLNNGRTIRVRGDIDAGRLARVVDALEGGIR